MFSWFKAAIVRAIKSAAQGAIAAIGTTAVAMGDVDWAMVGGAALLMLILSLLTSLAGIPEVDDGASVLAIASGSSAASSSVADEQAAMGSGDEE